MPAFRDAIKGTLNRLQSGVKKGDTSGVMIEQSSTHQGSTMEKTTEPALHVESQPGINKDDDTSNIANEAVHLETTPYVIFFAIFIGLAGWLLNFDLGYSGTVLQMDSFKASFAVCQTVHDSVTGKTSEVCAFTTIRQAVQSLSSIFIAIGAAFSGITATYFGRRGTIQVGCFIICIGAAGQMGCQRNYAAYVACKCIAGFGMGHIYTSAVPYGVEFVPPQNRGFLIALYNLGYAVGSMTVSAVCLGSSTLTSDWAWKTPMVCQIPIAIVYAIGVMMFPESPRWLVLNGKEDRARKAFEKLFGAQVTPEVAEKQIAQIRHAIELDRQISSTTKWYEIFHRRYILRLATAVLVLLANILSGVFFVNSYGALFLAQIGVGSPFSVNLIMSACAIPGAFIGPFVVEYIGRRLCQIIGYVIMGSFMLIFSAVNSGLGDDSHTSKVVLIVFLCLWNFVYCGFISSSTWLIAAEVHSVRLRTYGQSCVMTLAFIFQFGSLFWTPFMISPQYGNLGANIGYYFFGLSAVFLILIIFMVPETAKLSLEQLDERFALGIRPWRTSLKRNKAIARGDVLVTSKEP